MGRAMERPIRRRGGAVQARAGCTEQAGFVQPGAAFCTFLERPYKSWRRRRSGRPSPRRLPGMGAVPIRDTIADV
jgi:hypothetical protein